jgi:hypothetical protein
MNARRLVAAALTAGAVLVPATSASATCYLGSIDICDKPTDPYTDPVVHPVGRTVVGAANDVITNPTVWPVYDAALDVVVDGYTLVVCTALC